jgi:hypothetical protein
MSLFDEFSALHKIQCTASENPSQQQAAWRPTTNKPVEYFRPPLRHGVRQPRG